MKLIDYKNPETGEKIEVDVHEIPGCQESGEIPSTVVINGVECTRIWGDMPIIIPIEMQSKHDRTRLNFRGTLNGKKNIF